MLVPALREWSGCCSARWRVYVAFAMALEDARGETVLPLGRRGKGRLDERPQHLEREAAVREQL